MELTPGIAGADEAGRGPLAGPVVAAAALIPDDFPVRFLNDSKKLDPAAREAAFLVISERCQFEIEFSWPDEIDRINILRASLAAMSRAISRLGVSACIVDGNQHPPACGCVTTTAVKGDGKYAAVAAASILAKVSRDRYMAQQAELYPHYGFERHFGYPTPDHLIALRTHGACPIHRRSFQPVRDVDPSFSVQASLF